MSQSGKESFKFADFHLDIPERLLIRNGVRIQLPEKAFETLCVLVKEAGHLVTKKDLMSKVWPDTFVEENSLDKSVSLLRQVLGERNGKEKFIETIRGHGYRFVGQLRKVESSENNNGSLKVIANQNEIAAHNQGFSSLVTTAKAKHLPIRKIGVAFGIVLVVLLAWNAIKLRNQKATQIPFQKIQSLAVLPLKNISGDQRQEYFADGMTDELITKLASVSSLRVISHTSVAGYKNTKKTMREIARELDVDAILEGSVLQVGDRVRITAQLIRAGTDSHLWAESYERDFQDILKLQNEVAAAITRQIRITLTPQEAAQFTSDERINPDAYQAYLRGLYYSDREITKENLRLAAEMFQKSVDQDPGFAAAYAQLSVAHSFLFFTFDPTAERLTKSKAALDRAFELKPGFAEGHLALGSYYYRGFRDYDRALDQLKIAEKKLPNNKTILSLQAAIYRRQGKWQEAVAAAEKVVTVNPRHAFTMFNTGSTYFMVRRYSEAQRYFDRCISLGPDEQNGYVAKAMNLVHWKGDLITARKILNKAPDKKNAWIINHQFWVEFLDRKYETAVKILASPYADPLQKEVFTGLTYLQQQRYELARATFENARERIEKELHLESGEYSVHGLLGLVLAGLGRKQEAVREGKRAVELLPVSKDATLGPNRIETLAVIYVMVGEYVAALDQIEYLLSIPSRFSVEMLRIDPLWDPLRNHPRFQKLIRK